MRSLLSTGYRAARRIVVAVMGTTVVALGVAMLVLPGPAIVVIPAGLAILALEFRWARRLLAHARERSARALEAWQSEPPRGSDPPPD
jgi:tellurite resistance protein TerC